MMQSILVAISVLWVIRIAANVASFAQLWWVKEYRWDRMFVHLKTPQGKWIYFLPFKRPRLSPKSLFLVGGSSVILAAWIVFSPFPLLLSVALADLTSFPLTWVLVTCINAPVALYHSIVIARARHMLRAHQTLHAIGITGSYGKTSVKEYLAAMLGKKYQVLKTAASKNGPIGIAEVVVAKLRPPQEWFVVEMGAYKRGEIAYMTGLVRPEVGIITAINAQHQDLFGSLENTMKAKYELVQGLGGRKIAILNADDARVRTMGGWAKKDGATVWWFGTGKLPSGKRVFQAVDIASTADRLSFDVVSGKSRGHVDVPLVGRHHVSNILASVAGCVACGMSVSEACDATSAVRPAPHTLEFVRGSHPTYIDDTFNNNPDAASAVLDVLEKQEGKKYLVFQPMIELGDYAGRSHEEVGEHAARVCDAVILTNPNWSEDFIRGVRRISKTLPVSVLSGERAAAYVRDHTGMGDTVAFKGKEAARVLARLQAK